MPPTGLIGIALMLALAWAMSERRRMFPWRLAAIGVALQFAFGVLLLHAPGVVQAFEGLARLISAVIAQADAGIEFVFGQELPDAGGPWGFIFAVKVLPVIIFFAALMGVLYHIGLMQRLVAGFAWLLRRTLGVTGAEALAMASNVFVGQTEAPLCVKPYLERFTRAQMATLMVGGFATIAGSVLAAYVGVLGGDDPAQRVMFIKHLLTASLMSAPAAFVIARIIVPETEAPAEESVHQGAMLEPAANVFDAAARGASDGLRLALNVGAMLIAFVALLALVNLPLEALSEWAPVADWRARHGLPPFTLQVILGWLLTPLALAIGAPPSEAPLLGSLLGQKVVLTEFVAFLALGDAVQEESLSPRTAQIAAYALCGFANFASIGIQIGGLTAIAPGQRRAIVTLALKAMLGGALASWMTAGVASVLI